MGRTAEGGAGRRRLAVATLISGVLILTALPALPASAAAAGTTHPFPGSGAAGVTRLCGPDPAYSCTTAGYAGKSTGWWGAKYGAGYASSNAYGYHNCTLYAAFRIAQNGAGDPGWSDNATGWDTKAQGAGTTVNQTPAVGAIAQWNSGLGHVAYVEVVTSTYIETTDDAYGSNRTNRYRISASSAAWPDNFIHFKDITPPVSAWSSPDLVFIKKRNTGSGKIEVHWLTAASGFQTQFSFVTKFSPADADNGVFQMANVDGDGSPDLVFIKTRNTGSGKVEVHWLPAAGGYTSQSSFVTRFSPADRANGTFQMTSVDGDAFPDLAFIKKRNTGSGKVEVHWLTAASGFQAQSSSATKFSPADRKNGIFQLSHVDGDASPDLVFIKTRNTGSGKVEVHWLTAASGFQSQSSYATKFSPADRTNGSYQMSRTDGDATPDLAFIKKRNASSGKIEVHWLTAASGFQAQTSYATKFSPADASNGTFQVGPK